MLTLALDQPDASANRTLMVGDSTTTDGAAASLGIDTLILPMPDQVRVRGLDAVVRLATI